MAQIDFFANEADLEELWELLFIEIRVMAYPDPHFGNRPPPALTDAAAVAAQLRVFPKVAPGLGYFLVSKTWSREPLEYKRCDNNPHFPPYWYVNQRYGGPAIHFIPSFGFPAKRPDNELISGMFGDYPSYYSVLRHSYGDVIPRPPGLAQAMSSVRQKLLSKGVYVRSSCGKRAIALPGALAAQEHGVTLRQGDIVYTANKAFQRTLNRSVRFLKENGIWGY